MSSSRPTTRPSTRWALKVLTVSLVLWFGPIVAIYLLRGGATVFDDLAIFFSKMAMVTFGGAYAVLSYVAQQAVEHYGWLKPGEQKTVSWKVKGTGEVKLTIGSTRGGVDTRTLDVR